LLHGKYAFFAILIVFS